MAETLDKELHAMAAVAKALDTVKEDAPALERILKWAFERYGRGLAAAAPSPLRSASALPPTPTESSPAYGDVAELFDAAQPRTDWAKTVVVAHWLMTGESKPDFTGQEVNDHLKHLGHGVANVTDSLNKAMRQKPALVIQTAKTGTSKQARKKYKITRAGMTAVEKMVEAAKHVED